VFGKKIGLAFVAASTFVGDSFFDLDCAARTESVTRSG
jgi:hypothetical protein